ncbi:hypothetical protein FGO68_gene8856 [Halteria grandinella]|uniref:CS domain-containing protein n=1 Tax=Halteria grandinella TaxID=5974 RepID=A0A8J8NCT9_HALGN|nr:hypothetical protein FGO68_gene8856 [Halteria grandinella]
MAINLKVIILTLLTLATPAPCEVIQCASIYDYGTDESLRQHLLSISNDGFGEQNRLESVRCFKEMVDMNFFNSSMSQIDRYERGYLPVILQSIKEGASMVNERLRVKMGELQGKKDYIKVETPVQWAQSLSHVFIEVRYAHRHDAPGCSRSEDEQIEIKEDSIQLSVLCLETNSKVKYHLTLPLWDKIDPTHSKVEYQTVGKQHFTLLKARQPARWKQLYQTGEKKPINYRLWLTHHEKFVSTLWEYDGDAINDFEGYQWMEEHEEAYREYQHKKKIPKKGPIPIEKKQKKKKSKKRE